MPVDIASIRRKLRPPGPVLDVHVHPLPGLDRNASPQQAARSLLEFADRAGITRMVLSNIGRVLERSPSPQAVRQVNDECLAVRDFAPDRFVAFCYLNPGFPDEALAELERGVRQHGMVGVKLWVAVRASDPRVKLVAERAVALDVPVLQHVWSKTTGNEPGESTPADAAELARAVPHLRLIMGHLNGAGLKGVETVSPYPNIVVETGGSDPENGTVEAAVRALGSRRVVFGSDVAGRQFGTQLGKVLGANLSEVTKRRILWDNLARLLPASAGIRPEGDDSPSPEDRRR